ncbi:hypothetical protein ONE63_005738 [Megalurothrips usitatus]|uniref:Secreted protein n=1 Tax=Megalurothrips usitatus TaxID=439358 RepID=A0AAV7Y0K0_9NEOP|nr:hypothetical protein ONE63_005738 [Megalurothrips usitatus]
MRLGFFFWCTYLCWPAPHEFWVFLCWPYNQQSGLQIRARDYVGLSFLSNFGLCTELEVQEIGFCPWYPLQRASSEEEYSMRKRIKI